jgi:hypothetical protein
MAPPYCGFPSLSHQFPVVAEVEEVVTLVGVTVAAVVWVVVEILVVIEVVTVVDEVVVALLQDAKTIDPAKRQTKIVPKNPLFILPSI